MTVPDTNKKNSGGAWLVLGLGLAFVAPLESFVPPVDVDAAIDRAADRQGVPRNLLHALVQVESGKRIGVTSSKGAIGLSQVMPFNASRCGLPHSVYLRDPLLNLDCGAQILREELDAYGGNVVKALQSYNGGPKCIGKCRESLSYSSKVLALAGKG